MVAARRPKALLLAGADRFPDRDEGRFAGSVVYKSDAGGVRLNIPNAPAVRNAYHDIIETVHKKHPNARINGVSIEALSGPAKRPRADARRRSRPDLRTDHHLWRRWFSEVEIFSDRAVALPP